MRETQAYFANISNIKTYLNYRMEVNDVIDFLLDQIQFWPIPQLAQRMFPTLIASSMYEDMTIEDATVCDELDASVRGMLLGLCMMSAQYIGDADPMSYDELVSYQENRTAGLTVNVNDFLLCFEESMYAYSILTAAMLNDSAYNYDPAAHLPLMHHPEDADTFSDLQWRLSGALLENLQDAIITQEIPSGCEDVQDEVINPHQVLDLLFRSPNILPADRENSWLAVSFELVVMTNHFYNISYDALLAVMEDTAHRMGSILPESKARFDSVLEKAILHFQELDWIGTDDLSIFVDRFEGDPEMMNVLYIYLIDLMYLIQMTKETALEFLKVALIDNSIPASELPDFLQSIDGDPLVSDEDIEQAVKDYLSDEEYEKYLDLSERIENLIPLHRLPAIDDLGDLAELDEMDFLDDFDDSDGSDNKGPF